MVRLEVLCDLWHLCSETWSDTNHEFWKKRRWYSHRCTIALTFVGCPNINRSYQTGKNFSLITASVQTGDCNSLTTWFSHMLIMLLLFPALVKLKIEKFYICDSLNFNVILLSYCTKKRRIKEVAWLPSFSRFC